MRIGFLLVVASSTALAAGALKTDGVTLRDARGGVVILRGVNVAGDSKVPPFEPVHDGTLDPLPGWGVNAIRLLFTWEAYEPQPGAYDAGYLAYYRNAVEKAGALNLFVIVDFHQDGYSRFSLGGCGEGFPQWSLPPSVPPVTPDNGPNCVNWGGRMMTDATLKPTWDAFYADASGARTRFLAMLGSVASALANEPAVIGYDLLNEPGGDEATQIGPLYTDAAKAIRTADASAILFIEPSPILTTASKQTRLPMPTFDNFVYAPHFYDGAAFLIKAWTGDDESGPFAAMETTAANWRVPLFVGEFGADATTDAVDGYMTAVHHQLNLAQSSGTQWAYTPGWTQAAKDGWDVENFSIVDDAGKLRANFRPRPYPQRVAGTQMALTVTDGATPSDGSLELSWTHDTSVGETVLYLPADWFGGHVSLHADGDLSCKLTGGLAHCTSPTNGEKRVRADAPRSCGLTGAEFLLIALLSRCRLRLRRRPSPAGS
jgi:endoglycosylceramidase